MILNTLMLRGGPAGSGAGRAPVRPLLRRRPAPAPSAQLAVRAVTLGAALGTPPRGEVSPAPPPHVSPQAVTVRRMRRPVSVLRVRQSPPATLAGEPIRAVTLGAA